MADLSLQPVPSISLFLASGIEVLRVFTGVGITYNLNFLCVPLF